MIILGVGAGSRLVVEMTKEELANLIGERASYSLKGDPKAGAEFSVSTMFDEARKVLQFEREIQKNLVNLQEHITTFNGLLKANSLEP